MFPKLLYGSKTPLIDFVFFNISEDGILFCSLKSEYSEVTMSWNLASFPLIFSKKINAPPQFNELNILSISFCL